MLVPKPRGALSETLFEVLRAGAPDVPAAITVPPEHADDAQVSLWVLYELHYRGFEDVPDALEWHPTLLALRDRLERDFEADLRTRWVQAAPAAPAEVPDDFAHSFFGFVADHDGPSVAAAVQRRATAEQARDLLRLRSIYHLKESDPVAWVVPRLPVASKAGLMELQFDEYGAGDPNRLHAHLFALGLEASGLRPDYGAYLDEAPVEVLEQNNAMSLFGLHRRLRAAALGHLAAFEATSSLPSRRMAEGLERLGLPAAMIDYYREHVVADAVHEQLAVRTVCGPLLEQEPWLVDDVFFGAFTCLDLEDRFATVVLRDWESSANQEEPHA